MMTAAAKLSVRLVAMEANFSIVLVYVVGMQSSIAPVRVMETRLLIVLVTVTETHLLMRAGFVMAKAPY
jgi:hypothetical protein